MTNRAGVVMGVRLAKSHLADDQFRTVHGRCDACGQISDLEVIDDEYVLCTMCESTITWVRMRLEDDTQVVLTGR